MKRWYLYGLFTCFFLLESFVIHQFMKQSEVVEIDVVEVHELENQLAVPQPNYTEIQAQSVYAFSVIEEDSTLLFQGNEACASNQYEAWQQHNIVLTLDQERLAFVQDQRLLQQQEQQATQRTWFVVFLLLQIGGAIIYVEWLRYRIFTPFQKLRSFAQSITDGNLEVPLLMDKHQAFGAFSESFDMMRVELKKAKEQEMEANQSKKELIAKLSHDIKTPVASIKAVSELMQVQATNPKEQEQAAIILVKADQIDALISNLFHATLEELQQLEVQRSEESTKTLHHLLIHADYLQRLVIHNMEDALLWYDPLRISQVFDNIITNAYKYAPGTIEVYGTCKEEYFELIFQDHGGGVCEQDCSHIQEKFYRGENAKGKSGSGLGLYISTYFLQAMQASITITNYQDGLQITLCFPYAK